MIYVIYRNSPDTYFAALKLAFMNTTDTLELLNDSIVSAPSKKYVFSFKEGDGKNKQLLGGKGANLCEMMQIGLNVPPGFVISTEACLGYLADPTNQLQEGILAEVMEHMY